MLRQRSNMVTDILPELVLRSIDASWNYARWEQLPDDGHRYEVRVGPVLPGAPAAAAAGRDRVALVSCARVLSTSLGRRTAAALRKGSPPGGPCPWPGGRLLSRFRASYGEGARSPLAHPRPKGAGGRPLWTPRLSPAARSSAQAHPVCPAVPPGGKRAPCAHQSRPQAPFSVIVTILGTSAMPAASSMLAAPARTCCKTLGCRAPYTSPA